MTERKELESQLSVLNLDDLLVSRGGPQGVIRSIETMEALGNYDNVNVGTVDRPLSTGYVKGMLHRIEVGELAATPEHASKYGPISHEAEAAIWRAVNKLHLVPESTRIQVEKRIADLAPEPTRKHSIDVKASFRDMATEAIGGLKRGLDNWVSRVPDSIEKSAAEKVVLAQSDEFVRVLQKQFVKVEVHVNPGMGHSDEKFTEEVLPTDLISKRRFVNIALRKNSVTSEEAMSMSVGNHEVDNSSVGVHVSGNSLNSFETNLKLLSFREARLEAEIQATPATYRVDVSNSTALERATLRFLRHELLNGRIPEAEGGKKFSLTDLEKYGEAYFSVKKLRKQIVTGTITAATVLAACSTPSGGGTVETSQPPISTPITQISPEINQAPEVESGFKGTIATGEELVERNFLSQHPEFSAETATPISIEVNGTIFNLIEAEDGRYFMEINGQWQPLPASEEDESGQNLIILQHFPKGGVQGEISEPIVWFPAMTREQWNELTSEQRSSFVVSFAPPSSMESLLSDYTRADDGGIPLSLHEDVEVPEFLISLGFKSTGFSVPNGSETQIPQSETLQLNGVVPEDLSSQADLLAEHGYTLAEGRIFQTDTGEEVVRFDSSGNAVISALDGYYHRGEETTLSAEEAKNISIVSLNAGNRQLFVIKNDEGEVEKMFLPNKDNNVGTEAGWVAPIEISQDQDNPTKISSTTAIHTRHVYYSSMLGLGGEPWPEDFPSCRYGIIAGATSFEDQKVAWSHLWTEGYDDKGETTYNRPIVRNLGFLELDYLGEHNVINLVQCKINESGESQIFNFGWSGDETAYATTYTEWIPYMMLYQAFDNNMSFESRRGGVLRYLPGAQKIYDTDKENQPWMLIPEEIEFMESLDGKQAENQFREIADPHELDKLEEMIILPYL